MAHVLFVRLKSNLDKNELEPILLDRKSKFLNVPGLVQKVYGKNETADYFCGIYFFESKETLNNFRESELAKTIPSAYEAVDIRLEVYEVIFPLRPECGPLTDWNE